VTRWRQRWDEVERLALAKKRIPVRSWHSIFRFVNSRRRQLEFGEKERTKVGEGRIGSGNL
jgi:hypothetical protein